MTDPLPADAASWPAPETVTCPQCQTELTYYDPNSSYYGCTNCQSFFKAEYNDPPRLIRTRNFQPANSPILPLGAEGYLRGEWVRVTGYMRKQERNTTYQWAEYMLLLQDGTTRQLAEYTGHWMWIGPSAVGYVISKYAGSEYILDAAGDDYRLYARYEADLLTAIGEFDWNAVDDESLKIREFIRPPRMLVNEKDKGHDDWYEANYLTGEDIEAAFDLPVASTPAPYGVGAIQPNKAAQLWTTVLPLTLVVALALFVIHIVNIVFRPSGTVLAEQLSTVALITHVDSVATPANPLAESMGSSPAALRAADSTRIENEKPIPKTIRTRSFDIVGPTAVDIEYKADVSNTWVEFATELVNEQTNQRYIFTEAVEYYSGNDGGESWSEGGTDNSATLSKIPSGRYHLEITPYTQYGQALPFSVVVGQNTSLVSNVLILLVVLAIYPIYLLFQRSTTETQRWSQSDFGPSSD